MEEWENHLLNLAEQEVQVVVVEEMEVLEMEIHLQLVLLKEIMEVQEFLQLPIKQEVVGVVITLLEEDHLEEVQVETVEQEHL
tara:strand:+ start:174 stop:422 length:249 start_codon:yes stop_codon:yes gene_type:complete